jgi:DNA-binding transcriptional LysR family regulator
MTLRQLEIFVVVATRLNLRAAGEVLRIAQPTISLRLRLLEQELGTKLYTKTGRGIQVTPPGELLLREAKDILLQIDNVKVSLRKKFTESNQSSLTIGGSYTASTTCLPLLLARFKKSHKNVRLDLRTNDGWFLARTVLTGDVDVAIVHNRAIYRRLAAEPFGLDPVVACVSRKHPLAKKKSLTSNDMRNFGFIVRKPLNNLVRKDQFIEHLKRKGFKPQVVMECDSAEAKMVAVKNQMGIGLIFKPVGEDALKKGELVELKLPGGPLYWKSYIIYHKTKSLSPAAQDFLQLLRDHRAKLQKKLQKP